MLFQQWIFPAIPEWAFVGFHSLFVLSTLLSHCDAFFLPDISPEVRKSFFPGWLGEFDGLFPKYTIESFTVFFEHFVLGVKLPAFLKAPYSLGFS